MTELDFKLNTNLRMWAIERAIQFLGGASISEKEVMDLAKLFLNFILNFDGGTSL